MSLAMPFATASDVPLYLCTFAALLIGFVWGRFGGKR